MKQLCIFASLALFLRIADARLYHVPLGGRNLGYDDNRQRSLANADDTDLDNLYQARGVQYADLKVGCPAQAQSAIISTASPAIGFPCSGCTNDCGEGNHLNGLYHEQLSTCFSKIGCGKCQLSSFSCTQRQCPVSLSYLEGSSWTGYEVEDMISVGGETSVDEAFPLRFGCQTDITGMFEGQIPDGIFGMNKAPGSAIRQWTNTGYLEESAFSLCYNVREDVKKKSGVMVLGGADDRLHESPMVYAQDVGAGHNFEVRVKDIRLQRGSASALGVSTNAKTNNIPLNLSGSDTAVLDSATTCTYLHRDWRGPLEDAWAQLTDSTKWPMFTQLSSMTDAELKELPTIIFELQGADSNNNDTISVAYPPIRYMEKMDSGGWDFCMFADSVSSTVTLGNTFMAGHDVLHDIGKQRIGFAESKCEFQAISVTSDADMVTEAPVTNQSNPKPSMTLTKPKVIGLQSEPIHKRKQRDPTTPLLDSLYALLALGALVVAIVLYRRRKSLDVWNEPNTKHAFQLSIISLVMTVLAVVAGVALFSLTGSSLFLAFGLENCVDFLSSAVVLWRFFAPSGVTDKLEAKLKRREKRASIAISVILVVLGLGVWITAFEDLMRGQEDPSQQKTALAISFFSFFFFSILTLFKFRYAKVLDSPSLYKDGICSMVGTTLSASLFIDTLIIKATPAAWWMDPTVAIVCGLVALVYGTRTLCTEMKSKGDDGKDDTEEDEEDASEGHFVHPVAELT